MGKLMPIPGEGWMDTDSSAMRLPDKETFRDVILSGDPIFVRRLLLELIPDEIGEEVVRRYNLIAQELRAIREEMESTAAVRREQR